MRRGGFTVDHCAIVVLAAGKSSRLGRPKQSLVYKGKSLLLHAVDSALETSTRPVIIVIGANSDSFKEELDDLNIRLVQNNKWEEGIASSICCGLSAVLEIEPGIDGVIFMVCDQPYLNNLLIERLIHAQHETGLPIVASSYENILGTPTLFHKSLFNELMDLKGDTGAGKLIRKYENLVTAVPFPKGIIDIDTIADYEALL